MINTYMLIEHIMMRFKIMNIHDKYNVHVNRTWFFK